jgi:hypothetical protein
VGTATKLGVNVYQYFHDRITQTNAMPQFASLIEERATMQPLSASWSHIT